MIKSPMTGNSESLTSGHLVLASDTGEPEVVRAGGVVLVVEEPAMETLQARTLGEVAEPGGLFPLVISCELMADLGLHAVPVDSRGRFSVTLRKGAHFVGVGQQFGDGKSQVVRIDTWAPLTEEDRNRDDLVIIIDGESGAARVRRP